MNRRKTEESIDMLLSTLRKRVIYQETNRRKTDQEIRTSFFRYSDINTALPLVNVKLDEKWCNLLSIQAAVLTRM